jgi:hypothetical protein
LLDAGQRGGDKPTVPGRANYRITDPEAMFLVGPKAHFKKKLRGTGNLSARQR